MSTLLALFLFLVALQPLLAGAPKLHRNDGKRQIEKLEESWRQAVLHADAAAMGNLLADDYMGITANGTLQTKDQMLDAMRSGRLHVTEFTFSDTKVRFYGRTAVVTSMATIEGTNQEGELQGNFRYTRVYIKNPQGEWKIVNFETSRLLRSR